MFILTLIWFACLIRLRTKTECTYHTTQMHIKPFQKVAELILALSSDTNIYSTRTRTDLNT